MENLERKNTKNIEFREDVLKQELFSDVFESIFNNKGLDLNPISALLMKEKALDKKYYLVKMWDALNERVEEVRKSGMDVSESRLERVLSFFVNTDGGRYAVSPLERVNQLFDYLPRPENLEERKKFEEALSFYMQKTIKLAFDQHLENPEQYTSHGFDHTLNVTNNVRQVYTQNPAIVQSLQDIYGVTEGEAKFLLENVAIYHDFGYAYVGERNKAAHVLSSAELFNTPQMRENFRSLLHTDLNDELYNELFERTVEAILHHGSDKIQDDYDLMVKTSHGEILTKVEYLSEVLEFFALAQTPTQTEKVVEYISAINSETLEKVMSVLSSLETNIPAFEDDRSQYKYGYQGRFLDLNQKGDNKLGLEMHQTDIVSDDPLHTIRIADNMDEAYSRLTPMQTHPAFQEIYETFGYELVGGKKSIELKMLEERAKSLHVSSEFTEKEKVKMLKEFVVRGGLYRNDIEGKKLDKSVFENANLETMEDVLIKWKLDVIVDPILSREEFLDIKSEDKLRMIKFSLLQPSGQAHHYSGCVALKSFGLNGSEMEVVVRGDDYDRLNEIEVSEKGMMIPVGQYKIWRAMEAYGSITIAGKEVSVRAYRVVNEEDVELRGVSERFEEIDLSHFE